MDKKEIILQLQKINPAFTEEVLDLLYKYFCSIFAEHLKTIR